MSQAARDKIQICHDDLSCRIEALVYVFFSLLEEQKPPVGIKAEVKKPWLLLQLLLFGSKPCVFGASNLELQVWACWRQEIAQGLDALFDGPQAQLKQWKPFTCVWNDLDKDSTAALIY